MLQMLHRKPWVGLLGLAVGFLTQPLGHATYRMLEVVAGEAVYWAAAATGILGLVVIWNGLKQEELRATWMGMLGGWILWLGWFEYAFRFFSVLYAVPPYLVEPEVPNGYAATPHANVLQSTVSIMLALLVLYGFFNLQTKCNFMRFFHRNLKFSPGMPTPDNKRSFARITAMEQLFVTWFCYLFWLFAVYLGTRGTGAQLVSALYFAWTAWALYLVYRCTLQVRTAAALRYGVGAGIVLWPVVEMPAHFQAYREYWLHPLEYPVFNTVLAVLFVAGLALVANRPARLAQFEAPVDRQAAPGG